MGAQIAAELVPGDLVTVAGELGTGKTTLVRGACRALGVDDPITSPTFTIGHRRGRVDVSHLDLYRFAGVSAAEWETSSPISTAPSASSSGPKPARTSCRLRAFPSRSSTPATGSAASRSPNVDRRLRHGDRRRDHRARLGRRGAGELASRPVSVLEDVDALLRRAASATHSSRGSSSGSDQAASQGSGWASRPPAPSRSPSIWPASRPSTHSRRARRALCR